jgi:toxin ParE1/3/4
VKLRWTQTARDDLRAIRAYISRDNPEAADRLVARIRQRARDGAAFPLSGPRIPDSSDEQVREFLVGRYRIIYRVGSTLDVLTVIEGHRLLRSDALE